MNKRVLIFIFAIIQCACSFSQYKVVNLALKEMKHRTPNVKLAQGYMKGAMDDSVSAQYSKTWYLAGVLEHKIFDTERESKHPDYTKMYNSVLNAHNYFIKAAELDLKPNKKGVISPQYLTEIKAAINDKKELLVEGGAYFWDIKDYEKAYKMFDTYVGIPHNDIFKNSAFRPDTSYYRIMFLKGLACSKLRNPRQTISIYESMKGTGYRENDVYQFITYEYRIMKDRANFERSLMEGAYKFPGEIYFVNTLIDYYIKNDEYDKALSFIDKSIAANPISKFYNIKGRLLEKDLKNEEAAMCYVIAIDRDTTYLDAISNAGRIYYNRALDLLDVIYNRSDEEYDKVMENEIKPLYVKSLPFYERAYRINPDDKTYFNALRTIYYRLGMTKEGERLAEEYQRREDSQL